MGEVGPLLQGATGHGGFDESGHLFGGEGFGVEHQVEKFGGGFGFAEPGLAAGAVGCFQVQQHLARGGPFQPVIEHEIADAHVLRCDHVNAQHTRKIARLQFTPDGAVDNVVFGKETRQN